MAMVGSTLSVSISNNAQSWQGAKDVPANLDQSLIRLIGFGMILNSNWDPNLTTSVKMTLDGREIYAGHIRP